MSRPGHDERLLRRWILKRPRDTWTIPEALAGTEISQRNLFRILRKLRGEESIGRIHEARPGRPAIYFIRRGQRRAIRP